MGGTGTLVGVRRLLCLLSPLAMILITACSSAPAHPAGQVRLTGSNRAATTFSDWPMWHRNAIHSGHVAHPAGSPLHRAWAKNLGNAVYGEPLVVGDTLVAATEGNLVVGMNARTGHRRWSTGLGRPQPQSGLPCGD